MYIITNREIRGGKTGVDVIGERTNTSGPHELRCLEVSRAGRKWKVKIINDVLERSLARTLIAEHRLNLDVEQVHYASLQVACGVATLSHSSKKDVVLYIPAMHDIESAISHADKLSTLYGVEPVLYLYSSNAGGINSHRNLQGVFQDLITSTTALARVLAMTQEYRALLTEDKRNEQYVKAMYKFPKNRVARGEENARLMNSLVHQKISLLVHGAGAYLLQQVIQEPLYQETLSGFDNVVLCNADVAARGHEAWIDRIRCQGQIYLTINEDDELLGSSRRQTKTERLGEDTTFYASQKAIYVNFTGAPWVRQRHDVLSAPAEKNKGIRRFFTKALAGQRAERGLAFDPSGQKGKLSFTVLHGADLAGGKSRKRLAPWRTCFFGFNYTEADNLFLMETLHQLLADQEFGIELTAPISGRTDVDVLRDIDNQLHAAHFGIVDVSARSANVYIETGMLVGLGRPIIIIRDASRNAPLPFNVGSQLTVDYTIDRSGEKPAFVGLEDGIRNGVEAILTSNSSLRRAAKWPGEASVETDKKA
ncbi:MAG: hypothetical protein AAGF72_08015 [Pseudomonadota bacterium]